MIDFSRLQGLIDIDLLREAKVVGVGAGGAASLYRNLARVGVGELMLIDFDTVSATNPATQSFGVNQCGRLKVEVLAEEIHSIAPHCRVEAIASKVQDLSVDQRRRLLNADLLLAMTDDFLAQASLNRFAVKHHLDTIFAGAYPEAAAVEVSGTFAEAIEAGIGCHRCHLYQRYAFFANHVAEASDVEPIPSHIFQAEYLNALLGNLALSHLHQRAGSPLGNPQLARQFVQRPLLIARLDPAYQSAPEQAYGGLDRDFHSFTARHWPRQTPNDFPCADCGTTLAAAPGDLCAASQGERRHE